MHSTARIQHLVVACVALAAILLTATGARARNLMVADGPGGTYDLLKKAYSVEVPDCKHMVDHMTEDFDTELNENVFIFHLHVTSFLDDDRCSAQDRQRTEIRAKASDVTALINETVYYRWKFKLPAGFQATPDTFAHIMQIKSDQADPIVTLTPHTKTIEIGGRIGVHGTTDVSKFIGVWVVADMKVLYSHSGNIAVTIRRLSDGATLMSYSGGADMWDDSSGTHDFKCGIYRSLDEKNLLRDEQVRFADICVSKVSASECDDILPPWDGGVGVVDAGGPADASTRADARAPEAGGGGAGGMGDGGAGGTTGSSGIGGAGGSETTGAGGDGSGGGGAGGSSVTSGAGGNGGSPPASGGAGSISLDAGSNPPVHPASDLSGCTCNLRSRGEARGSMIAFIAAMTGALVRRRRRSRAL